MGLLINAVKDPSNNYCSAVGPKLATGIPYAAVKSHVKGNKAYGLDKYNYVIIWDYGKGT